MKRFTYSLLVIFLIGLFSFGYAYQIEGNSVVIEDDDASLRVTPHTAYSPIRQNLQQEFEICNKTGSSQNLFVAYLFDKQLSGGKAEYYTEPSDYYSLVESVCAFDFNYTLNKFPGARNPHEATCFQTIEMPDDANIGTQTLYITEWVRAFKTGDVETKTINVDTLKTNPGSWSNITSSFTQNAQAYQGKYIYPNTTGVSVGANSCKKWKITYTPHVLDFSEKWDMILWSGASWNCILSDTCTKTLYLDPWWSASWLYKKPITVTATVDLNAGFPVDLNVTDFNLTSIPSKTCGDLSDVRVIYGDTEIAVSIENIQGTDQNRLWFELQQPITAGNTDPDYNVYYGNSGCPARTINPDLNSPASDFNISAGASLYNWHFEEATAPYLSSGTLTNFTWVTGNEATKDMNQSYLTSLQLNGVDDFYAISGDPNEWSFPEGTIEVWFNPLQSATWKGLFGYASDGGQDIFASEIHATTGFMQISEVVASSTKWTFSRTTTPADFYGKWHHLQCDWNSGGGDCKLDGLSMTLSAGSAANFTGFNADIASGKFGLGARMRDTSNEEYFRGNIDEFRISSYQKNVSYQTYDFSNAVQNHAILTVGAEVSNVVTAHYDYTTEQVVSGSKVIVHLDANSTTEFGGGISATGYEWFLGGTLISVDQNVNNIDLNYAASYDLTLRVTTDAGGVADDENKTITIAGGTLGVHFSDENTQANLAPTITVNGTPTTVNDSKISFDLNNANTIDYTVLTTLANYTQRQFFWEDINQFANVDVNAVLLLTTKGLTTNFKFYNPAGLTALNSAVIELSGWDANIAERRQTSSAGLVSFFMNPEDINYSFIISDANGEVYTYNPVYVTFSIPKNEDSNSQGNIIPYNLDITGAGIYAYTAQITPLSLYLYPNTISFYTLDLNGGNLFNTRKLETNYKGNPQSATIQMYLSAVESGSFAYTFYTINEADHTALPNIKIQVFKTIPGEGVVNIATLVTDSSGIATIPLIQGDQYTLYYYDSSDNLLSIDTLVAAGATTDYYKYLNVGTISWSEVSAEYLHVNLNPSTGYIRYGIGGVDISIVVDTNGTIEASWLSVANNNDHNMYWNGSCGSGCEFNIPAEDLNNDVNNGKGLVIRYCVINTSGLTQCNQVSLTPIHEDTYHLLSTLRGNGLRNIVGCSGDINSPCFFLLFLSALLTLFVVASLGVKFSADPHALSGVALACVAIFTYLNWVPFSYALMAALIVVTSMVLTRRYLQ